MDLALNNLKWLIHHKTKPRTKKERERERGGRERERTKDKNLGNITEIMCVRVQVET